jgi:hypothetical protein
MRRSVATIALVVLAAGCARSNTKTYDPDRSAAALQRVGWIVTRVATPPETVGGGGQLAYLQTTAPDRRRIDLQFLEGPDGAADELAARRRRAPDFAGTAIGNVVVIPQGERTDDLPDADVAALRSHLAT